MWNHRRLGAGSFLKLFYTRLCTNPTYIGVTHNTFIAAPFHSLHKRVRSLLSIAPSQKQSDRFVFWSWVGVCTESLWALGGSAITSIGLKLDSRSSFYCLYESVRQVTFLIRILQFDSLIVDGGIYRSTAMQKNKNHFWAFELVESEQRNTSYTNVI